MTKNLKPVSIKSILLATAMLSSVPAYAQEQGGPDGAVSSEPQEILVTAQKRQQSRQDIGISITALGGDDLAAMGRQDVTALVSTVPSLQIQQFSPTVTVFNLRGVSQNDFADSQEAPVAFYNDEVYVSQLGAISGQNFDLERIEVLRGPQGTLFGRNATGGLIQVITAKPTNQLDGFLTVTAGSNSQIATEGAISGPLSDTVRARLSFTTDNRDGYVKNLIGRDLGGTKFYAGRIQVAADVAGGELTLKGQYLRNDHDSGAGAYSPAATAPDADGLGRFLAPGEDFYGTCAGCTVLGFLPDGEPHRVSQNHRADFNRKYWSLTGRYVKDFGAVTLTSITDYQDLSKDYTEDSDASPLDGWTYFASQRAYQYSQELRLSGSNDRLNWVVGGYGIKIRTRNDYSTFLPLYGIDGQWGGVLDTSSLATFGQVEYKLSDMFSVIGGLRYSKDIKKINYQMSENGTAFTAPFVFNQTLFPDLARQKFENYSGKFEIDFKPSTGTLIYLSVNRGTKSGGFGSPALQPVIPTTLPFDQEELTNFEGGVKLTMFDRTTHLNMSAFHYKYNDYQAFTLVGISQAIVNRDARIDGFEIDFDTRPLDGLYAQAFFTYLDAKVFDITLPGGRVADRRMPQAPKTSFGGLLRYQVPIGSGTASFQTDWKYNGSSYFTAFNAEVDREPSYVIGNVRAAYKFGGDRFEVAGFINNVTDKAYRIYNLDVTGVVGIAQQSFARPRWGGVSFTYRMN